MNFLFLLLKKKKSQTLIIFIIPCTILNSLIVSIDDDESVSSIMFDCSLVSSVLSKISFRADKILINKYLMQHKDIFSNVLSKKKKFFLKPGFRINHFFFLNRNLTS